MSQPTEASPPDFVRPTAEHIAGLFRTHDAMPRQSVYLTRDDPPRPFRCEACAVGILLVNARGGIGDAMAELYPDYGDPTKALQRATGWPMRFVDGLDNGFSLSSRDDSMDEAMAKYADDDASELYCEGFRVGWKAWQLAMGEG